MHLPNNYLNKHDSNSIMTNGTYATLPIYISHSHTPTRIHELSSREGPLASIFHKFSKFRISCRTLLLANFVPNDFSVAQRPNQSHQHTFLDKLTGHCRKRLPEFWTKDENVATISESSVH